MKLNKWHMIIASILFLVVGYFTSSTAIEIASTVSGLLCVWLAAKQNIWTYPIGFVNIVFFMIVFYDARLYADFSLQIFFAVLSTYGWIYWLRNKGDQPVKATQKTSAGLAIAMMALTIIGTALWGYVLHQYTDASIPYADAFIAILSVVAQILLSSKRLENWYVWILVDVLSVGMYFYKGLHVIGILYIVFTINAIYGAIAWHKQYKEESVNV
ncbi:nicotinamide riboside transporter PnuC [Paenibacillus sp. FSL R7-0302]|uniref:nicotinamide riboside transporter PnuC n=1 Tax=Paenibacillus sp. FSL R7-0302 TaxID=2921681 RepID=UPI0030FC1F66